MEISDKDFQRLSLLVQEKCGINLNRGKKALLRMRLARRLRQLGLEDFGQYYRFVTRQADGSELTYMLDAISTNLTSFFREPKHFQFLVDEVFPAYLRRAKGHGPMRLRFWSAGGSSGEEAYSLAICVLEHLKGPCMIDIKILSSDISTKVLRVGMHAVYPAYRMQGVPPALLDKYFERGEGEFKGYFRVKRLVRELVEFRRVNLREPFPFKGPFDLILCRNVMIYFDSRIQEELVNKFYHCLVDGGYLFTGHAESLMRVRHPFRYVRPAVYQRHGRG